MTNGEVLELEKQTNILISHLQEKKCDNFKVNYRLVKNHELLIKEAQLIHKTVSKELLELENEITQAGQYQYSGLPEDEKIHTDAFKIGQSICDKIKVDRQKELYNEYLKSLEIENDIELKKLKIEDIEFLKIEPSFILVLLKHVDDNS